MDLAPLDAVLCRDAFSRPQLELVGKERDESAAPPVRHLPLKEVLVPLADLKAVPPALWLVRVLAVGVVGRPALHVDTPYCPRLNPTGATLLPNTLTPVTCKQGETPGGGIFIKTGALKDELNCSLQSTTIQGHSFNLHDCFIHERRREGTKKRRVIQIAGLCEARPADASDIGFFERDFLVSNFPFSNQFHLNKATSSAMKATCLQRRDTAHGRFL